MTCFNVVISSNSPEKNSILNTTPNITHFFRGQIDIWHAIANKIRSYEGEKLRVLSAGCSRGYECFSIGALILHLRPNLEFEIIGVDNNPYIIEAAKEAQISRDTYLHELKTINPNFRQIYTKMFGINSQDFNYHIIPSIKNSCTFVHTDLLDIQDEYLDFDIIICRNVKMYLRNGPEVDELDQNLISLLSDKGLYVTDSSFPVYKAHLSRLDKHPFVEGLYKKPSI
jgi:chemotaxis methyl-accepting protein methylase